MTIPLPSLDRAATGARFWLTELGANRYVSDVPPSRAIKSGASPARLGRAAGALAVVVVALLGCTPVAGPAEHDAGADTSLPPPDAAVTPVEAFAFSGFRVVPIRAQGDTQTSEGFDIDGTATSVCGHPDLATPAGDAGVDNQFAVMWVRFAEFLNRSSAAELEAMNQILNAAPAEGSMLMGLFLERPAGDEQGLRLRVQPLSSLLLTGADERVLPFQTVVQDADFHPASAAATEVGSVVTSAGVDFTLPFEFFGFTQALQVTNSLVRFERTSSSSGVAYFAFTYSEEALLELAADYAEYFEFYDIGLANQIVPGMAAWLAAGGADLDPDAGGQCRGVSMQFAAELVPVFAL